MNQEVVMEELKVKKAQRIQRMNYIALCLFIFVFAPVMMTTTLFKLGLPSVDVFEIAKIYQSGGTAQGMGTSFDLLAFWYIQLPVFFYLSLNRVRDIGWNQWLAVISAVPLVNFILWFWPGNKGENQYGKQPANSSFSTKLFVFTSPLSLAFIMAVSFAILNKG